MTDFILYSLACLFVTILAIYYWQGLKIRELAIAHARRHCRDMQLQLLDQSVSLAGLSVGFDRQRLLALVRRYHFEFTATGDERYRGEISMRGQFANDIWLQPHRLPDSDSASPNKPLN